MCCLIIGDSNPHSVANNDLWQSISWPFFNSQCSCVLVLIVTIRVNKYICINLAGITTRFIKNWLIVAYAWISHNKYYKARSKNTDEVLRLIVMANHFHRDIRYFRNLISAKRYGRRDDLILQPYRFKEQSHKDQINF